MINRQVNFVRNPEVVQRNMDDSAFLVDPETDIVFYLNALSTGIWNILETSISLDDIINIVQKAFPDVPSKKIDQDVTELIKKMHKKNIVLIKE